MYIRSIEFRLTITYKEVYTVSISYVNVNAVRISLDKHGVKWNKQLSWLSEAVSFVSLILTTD